MATYEIAAPQHTGLQGGTKLTVTLDFQFNIKHALGRFRLSVSDDPAASILDLAATLGIDILVLGTPHRHALVRLLKGNVVTEVAENLPENIQLIIYG